MDSRYSREVLGLPTLFSDPHRIQLLGLLTNVYPGEITPTEMVRTATFNYTSLYNHLHPLEDLGIVHSRSETGRKAVYYTLHPEFETVETLADLHDACRDWGILRSANTFRPLFTTGAHARIVASLVHLGKVYFTQPVVTDYADVSKTSFYNAIPSLKATGLVARAGKDGRAYRYERLNQGRWNALRDLERTIVSEFGSDARPRTRETPRRDQREGGQTRLSEF